MLLAKCYANFCIDLCGASNHLHYLRSNWFYLTELTSDVERITLVRVAERLVGYVQFRKLKTITFVSRWLCNLFNTNVNESKYDVIYDFVNWNQKFEFDNSNCIFYDFFFEKSVKEN